MSFDAEVSGSVSYLASEAAASCLAADAYWPKWDAPWWHMLLLHEMGKTSPIPAIAIEELVKALHRYPVKVVPIHSGDMPEAPHWEGRSSRSRQSA